MTVYPDQTALSTMTGAEKFAYLRTKYKDFVYKGFFYRIERTDAALVIACKWYFNIPGLTAFLPTSVFSLPACACAEERTHLSAENLAIIESFLYQIGLMESVSYWKATACPNYVLELAVLDDDALHFWQNIFFNGLGEYLYRNGINVKATDLLHFVKRAGAGENKHDTSKDSLETKAQASSEALAELSKLPEYAELLKDWHYCERLQTATVSAQTVNNKLDERNAKVLIPVGGGKDSVVTLELLKDSAFNRYAFAINPSQAVKDCINLADIPESKRFFVKRQIDKNLLALNAANYLNGHTPFSGIVAFYSSFVAYLTGSNYIALSNEASANAATVEGTEINHQYSKTAEFEANFASYSQKYLGAYSRYFSFLRPLNEIAIAAFFSKYEQYFPVFRSCNLGSKAGANQWCGNCAKCLFVFIILSPYLSLPQLISIFGSDLLAKAELRDDFAALLGLSPVKPFECVGTVEEVSYAVVHLLNANKNAAQADSCAAVSERLLLRELVAKPTVELAPFIKRDSVGNYLYTAKYLFNLESAALLPVPFARLLEEKWVLWRLEKVFAAKKVLILGLGLEGMATLAFLLQNFQALKIKQLGVADGDSAKLAAVSAFCSSQYGRSLAELGLQTHFSGDYFNAIAQYDLVLKSPGIPFNALEYLPNTLAAPKARLAMAANSEISCQVELFLQLHGAKTLAISGTKGKSTTSTLVHLLLTACGFANYLLGNIGIPAFSQLTEMSEQSAALELSCHQLEFCAVRPQVAVLTNLYEEHLDHYHDLEEYYNTKLNLVRQTAVLAAGIKRQAVVLPVFEKDLMERTVRLLQPEQDLYYLCKSPNDLPDLVAYYATAFAEKVVQPTEQDLYLAAAKVFYFNGATDKLSYLGTAKELAPQLTQTMSIEAVQVLLDKLLAAAKFNHTYTLGEVLAVKHLKIDAVLATLAVVAYAYSKPEEKLTFEDFLMILQPHLATCNQALLTFKSLAHRLEYVGTFQGHKVYNDSISTIPTTCINALEALGGQGAVILGGLDRGIDYSTLIAYLQRHNLVVIGLPTTGWDIVTALKLQKGNEQALYLQADDMHDAVKLAYKYCAPQAPILLSPAAASYNTYTNFAARGKDFVQEIVSQGAANKEDEVDKNAES